MDDVFALYQQALRSGHQLAAEGRFKDALAHYEQAAKVAPERALPHVCVGSMQLHMGKSKDALAAYERALALEPNDLDALSGRAAALLAAGRRAEAAAAQELIAALRKAPPPALGTPAELHTPLTSAESLAIAGEQALESGQKQAAIDAWLLEARDHAGDRHFDAALDAATRALSLDTRAARVHLELTRIYFERGWEAEAADHVAALRRLLELAPDPELSAALSALTADQG